MLIQDNFSVTFGLKHHQVQGLAFTHFFFFYMACLSSESGFGLEILFFLEWSMPVYLKEWPISISSACLVSRLFRGHGLGPHLSTLGQGLLKIRDRPRPQLFLFWPRPLQGQKMAQPAHISTCFGSGHIQGQGLA